MEDCGQCKYLTSVEEVALTHSLPTSRFGGRTGRLVCCFRCAKEYTANNPPGELSTPPQEPLFRFGAISDVQYADVDDALNFRQDQLRRYRASLGSH
eukprot:6301804-Amphidinium_carterae.1